MKVFHCGHKISARSGNSSETSTHSYGHCIGGCNEHIIFFTNVCTSQVNAPFFSTRNATKLLGVTSLVQTVVILTSGVKRMCPSGLGSFLSHYFSIYGWTH